ncbi:TAXI family TRAP transporter solute-binding subunit [Nocardia sp. alder85J]|uniref:TAXI family TRAP transporter solute-binding subunit n=1 Tax=Nocardia sp. alder85J TaxID=2862949 RepID=UPI001CD3584D|nr:TAXI family TRAP transporter solute-binding subunit [Nocardia sp. alder85J]MCX4092871.1 TAXI family TRAP transporter solute-binding subunit [Nocardia sp. alder85J]
MIGRRVFLGLAAAAAASAAGCGGTGPPVVRVAAGEVGGFYHAFSLLLAAAAAEAGTLHVQPVTTTGSMANLDLLARGEVEAALTLTDAVADDPARLLAIGRVYENYLQLAVGSRSGLHTVEDLRGTRISLGAPGSGAAFTGERILRLAGLEPGTDLTVTHLPLQDAVTAIATGAADALLWAGGVPTTVLDVPRTLRLLDLGEFAGALHDRYGYFYDLVVIPGDTYPGAPSVRTIGVANLLVTTAALPWATAAALTELLLTHAAHLVPAEATGTQFLDIRTLIGTGDLALHPGSADVYRRHHG